MKPAPGAPIPVRPDLGRKIQFRPSSLIKREIAARLAPRRGIGYLAKRSIERYYRALDDGQHNLRFSAEDMAELFAAFAPYELAIPSTETLITLLQLRGTVRA